MEGASSRAAGLEVHVLEPEGLDHDLRQDASPVRQEMHKSEVHTWR